MWAIFVFTLLIGAATLSTLATIMAVKERDLVKATIYSALQSTAYALMYFLFMAPDLVLVYAAVSVGIYPLITLLVIKRVGRYE